MKKILDALDKENFASDQREISRAYIYAALAFLAGVCKGQSDVQHLWFGRRACTRMRSELMAAIYEKALKRKDFSGVTDEKSASESRPATPEPIADGKDAKKGKKGAAKKSKLESKAEDTRSSADVGKIVQLMSGDTNRIANMVAGMYMLYVRIRVWSLPDVYLHNY